MFHKFTCFLSHVCMKRRGGGTSGEENLRGWLDETSVSHNEKQSNRISLSSVTAAGNSCAEGGGEQSLTTVSPLSKSAAEEKVKNKKKQNPSEAPSSSSSSWGNVVQMWMINFLFPVAGWTLVVAPPLLIGPIIILMNFFYTCMYPLMQLRCPLGCPGKLTLYKCVKAA